ncbi:MAG: TIGR04076 family protein [Clostridia bacterium]|nr:TIGR04076 family protein [Clostridia bacterium]
MRRVKITAVRKADYPDLQARYENPIEHACDVEEGAVYWSENAQIPEGFCASAWENLSPYVLALSCGGTDLFDGWMKDPRSAMISCNDGFRPVSFYLEAQDE